MKNKGFNILVFLFISFGFSSCQFFETEKISSDEFLEEEIKAINWKDIDQYPVFKVCERETEKQSQKTCFETTLASRIYQSVQIDIRVSADLNQTVLIEFQINEKGVLIVSEIVMDSILRKQIPFLENNILRGLDSIQPIAPAYKRGIPVKTSFKLPIVVKSN